MRWSSPFLAFLLLALVAGKLAATAVAARVAAKVVAAAAADDDDREDNSDLNKNVKVFPDLRHLLPSPPGEVLPPEGPMITTPAQLKAPQPKTREEIIFHCWGYLGHPETILDVKSFFRWGCQPSANTCDGLRHLPQLCYDNMFAVYEWVTPRHVHRLLRRCRPGARRPIYRKNGRFIPYCRNFVDYLWKKYGKNRQRNKSGGRGRRGGHHPAGAGHHRSATAAAATTTAAAATPSSSPAAAVETGRRRRCRSRLRASSTTSPTATTGSSARRGCASPSPSPAAAASPRISPGRRRRRRRAPLRRRGPPRPGRARGRGSTMARGG